MNKPPARNNYDTPWKEILETHFRDFMMLCHPEAAKEIDWAKGYESLDKELSAMTKDAATGVRFVDKLLKVWRIGGGEIWILIHIEVQQEPEGNFARRMYTYYYRLFDRYQHPIVSIAIL